MSLEDFNADDEEIAKLFLGDDFVRPTQPQIPAYHS